MPGAVATIGISIVARTKQFMRAFRRMRRRLRRFGKTVNSVARAVKRMSVALSGLAIAGAFAFSKLAFAGEVFSRAMRRSQAIMGDLTKTMKRDMVRAALEAAKTTIFTSEQAAESFFFLASAGLNAKQSIEALPVVAQFAQAGMFDMARATELLTDAQAALGLKVKDARQNMLNMVRVSDVLVKANQKADATVEEFAEALTNKAAARMKFLNIRLEEGVALLAALADAGSKATEGGTALDIALRELTNKAKINAEAFKRAGLRVFEFDESVRPLADIIENLTEVFGRLTPGQRVMQAELLGITAKSSAFIFKLLGMQDAIREYQKALENAAGTTKEVAEKQLTPLERAIAKLEDAWVKLGLKMSPVIETLAKGIELLSAKIEEFAGSFTRQDVINGIVTFLNILDAGFRRVRDVIVSAALQISNALDSVFSALGKISDFFGIKGAATDFNRIVTEFGFLSKGLRELQRELAARANQPLLGTRLKSQFDEQRRIEREHDKRIREIEEIDRDIQGIFRRVDDILHIGKRAIETGVQSIDIDRIGKITTMLRRMIPTALGPLIFRKTPQQAKEQGTFQEIALSRTFLPGLSALQKHEQLVRDPQLARVIAIAKEGNRILNRGIVGVAG